ncbi:MAG TPA: radical SAM protein, partial [bacterium]|nr:radical SAM protein [bacterium]
LKDLGKSRVARPPVPLVDVVHNRAVVEIMRGCTRGCRFCQAGWAGRPVREKAPEAAAAEALEQTEATGCDEVSLLSLSSGDYRRIDGLLELLSPLLAERGVGISLPSLNAASISETIFRQLRRVRRSGITLAPEAGSVRMRKAINKDLAPEVLDGVVRQAKEQGWRLLKLYFMIGLPGERDEDVEAVAAVVDRLSRWGGDLNVTVSNFVPKAQTPFQWAPMNSPAELARKQALLRSRISSRRVKLKFRDPRMSFVEGLLAVGGRDAGRLLEEAYRRRCLFADWREHFDPAAWEEAAEASGLEPERFLFSPRDPDRPLPWAHIGGGVPGEVLLREYRRAEEASR